MDENLCELWVARCLWKTMRGWVVARNRSCNSQLSHFEKRRDLRETPGVRYFRHLPSFIYNIRLRGKQGILFRAKVMRGRERDAYYAFNKSTECYCCTRDSSCYFALSYRFSREIWHYQSRCRDLSEIFYTRTLHPKRPLTGRKNATRLSR